MMASKEQSQPDLHAAVRQTNARRQLIASFAKVPSVVMPLIARVFTVERSAQTEPVRVEVRDWSDRHGVNEHWFIERLVHVMYYVRRQLNSADDPRIFDPRFFFWITSSDYAVGAKEQAEAQIWRRLKEWETQPTDAELNAALAEGHDALHELTLMRPLWADPTTQTLSEFLSSAEAHYESRSKALAADGFPPKSGRGPRRLADHATWFIRHRFADETYLQIGADVHADWTTIRDGVVQFADVVGLSPKTVKKQASRTQPLP